MVNIYLNDAFPFSTAALIFFLLVLLFFSDVLDPNNILNSLTTDEYGLDEMLHPKTVYTVIRFGKFSFFF